MYDGKRDAYSKLWNVIIVYLYYYLFVFFPATYNLCKYHSKIRITYDKSNKNDFEIHAIISLYAQHWIN